MNPALREVVLAARERVLRCDTAQAAAVLDGIAERMEDAAARGDDLARLRNQDLHASVARRLELGIGQIDLDAL